MIRLLVVQKLKKLGIPGSVSVIVLICMMSGCGPRPSRSDFSLARRLLSVARNVGMDFDERKRAVQKLKKLGIPYTKEPGYEQTSIFTPPSYGD